MKIERTADAVLDCPYKPGTKEHLDWLLEFVRSPEATVAKDRQALGFQHDVVRLSPRRKAMEWLAGLSDDQVEHLAIVVQQTDGDGDSMVFPSSESKPWDLPTLMRLAAMQAFSPKTPESYRAGFRRQLKGRKALAVQQRQKDEAEAIERPFQCGYGCGKRYKVKHAIKRHMLTCTHTDRDDPHRWSGGYTSKGVWVEKCLCGWHGDPWRAHWVEQQAPLSQT